MATSTMDERTLTISGVKVVFPCKPYPSQFGMMDKVIKGLERKQNSLLESPTGSGKSLALLCAALAWQNAMYERITKENIAAQADDCCKPKVCQCGSSKTEKKVEYSPEAKPHKVSDEDEDMSDDDFRPASRKTPSNKTESKRRSHVSISYEDEAKGDCVNCMCGADEGPPRKTQKVPKIYFGTRTHKQIAQITRELRKTAYHTVRMAILASREHTCIHPDLSAKRNKSEGCREKLDHNGPGCKFNDKAKRVFLCQSQLQSEIPTAWDLEDLIGACGKKKACPYFVTRNIIEQADIIFCPYNYLIDPIVRKSMDINLKDQVMILDEAHNIEDCSRDAASGSITTDQISQAVHNIDELMENNIKFPEHLKLRNMLEALMRFIEDNSGNLEQQDYDNAYKLWSGFDVVARMKQINLGPDTWKEYERCFEAAMASDEDQTSIRDRNNQELRMSSATGKLLEQIFQILFYMYKDDMKFVEDYRVCILKSMQYVSKNKERGDNWLSKNRRSMSRVMVFTLNFWCMNPAVAFSDFSSCRNVVLSSGTLSPMSTFASELGTEFPIQLEASHIIEDKQVHVAAVGTGPRGGQLQAVYRNMEQFTFQDELGQLIHNVCTSVPHGVLCFLPSYRGLENFIKRWNETGLMSKISSRKRIMIEPRASDPEVFDRMMKAFYDVIKGETCSDYLSDDVLEEDDSDIDGAIFFAVCRGKVSEGMDFADNNARAVITVGIPFPSFKDLQVKLKREYNDKYRYDRGLLSGGDWYEIQAFRALNQALGRCIRHRKDWGALIMVDDRFVKNTGKYTKSLSRWIRSKVQTYSVFSNFIEDLEDFAVKMVKEMPAIDADTSFIPCTPANKRESINMKPSPDTPSQTSPYFGVSAGPSAPYAQTPTTSKKGGVFSPPYKPIQTPKGNNSTTAAIPSLVNLPVTSPRIQQQLKEFILSPNAPKDQPYYVILNKGLTNQQAFLINPSKSNKPDDESTAITSQSTSIQTPTRTFQIPQQNAGQLNQAHVPYVSNEQSGPGLSQLLTPTELGTSEPSKEDHSTNTGNNPSTDAESKQPTLVYQLDPSDLPVEEQLKLFLNSGSAPKGHAYYVVANKGTPSESTFLIEPDKKGKSKKGQSNKRQKSENAERGPETLTNGGVQPVPALPVESHIDKKPAVKSEAITVEADSSTSDLPDPKHPFLRFCNLPVTPAKPQIPVATVTPQRPECGVQDSNIKHDQAAAPSPDIFGDIADTKPDVDQAEKARVKKPIFRKKIKTETDIENGPKILNHALDDTSEVKGDSNVTAELGNHVEEAKGDNKEPDSVNTVKKEERRNVRGRNNARVVENLREIRKVGRDGADDKPDVQQGAVGFSQSSDEDFLNTRRRGNRKRKSTARYDDYSKRSKKGVTYDEQEKEEENVAKENVPTGNQLCCAACGHKLMKVSDYEKRKRHPDLAAGVFKKNTELLYFPSLKLEPGLVPVSQESHIKGVELNAVYNISQACCVQYLQCKGCKGPVLGATVLLAELSSTYKAGQTWVLSSAVKI
ncbi:Fanconi anemia group J protein homolog isoform X2 [Mya arenaria]|uniref:Fanconi anemia group J protein homolog isoform X2 n=1 Tax=Mya arenaria TaxID=6604 RepID=UPI0022E0433B|nr:Fanconi anemia group J protein homolog isoform X2 [Mya arenaria]